MAGSRHTKRSGQVMVDVVQPGKLRMRPDVCGGSWATIGQRTSNSAPRTWMGGRGFLQALLIRPSRQPVRVHRPEMGRASRRRRIDAAGSG